MPTTTSATEVSWTDIVAYDKALSLTGWSAADIDRMTTPNLECRAAGAWDANEREAYVGYRSLIAHRSEVRRFRRE